MSNKTKKILITSFSIVIIVLLPLVFKKVKINNTIKQIKENYISQEETIKNIDKEYIKKLNNKKNKTSEEEFIIGYVNKDDIKFELAYNKISRNTNRFVKYYLYNVKAKQYIDYGDIKSAKRYTENALKCVKVNLDYKSAYLIWQSLISYIDAEDGREYIVYTTEKYINKSNNDETIYTLRKYISPVLHLLGEREEAMDNLFQVIFIAEDFGDVFTNVKANIDLATIFIEVEGYDLAQSVLDYAIEKSNDIEDEEDKISLQLYAYIQKCNIYYLTEKYENLKIYIDKIYRENGKISEWKDDDFLILAKAYDSIYMSKVNRLNESKELINESKELLENDNVVLLSDKDITLELAEIELEISKKDYNKSIILCKKMLEKFKYSRSFRYELTIMNKLRDLYIQTQNPELVKVEEYIQSYDKSIENGIIQSYLTSNLSEYNNIQNTNKHYKQMVIEIVIITILTLILVLIMLRYKRKKQANELLKKDIEILNNQFDYQLSHYDNIKTYQEEVRLIWHDMKNHINTIVGLYNDNNDIELRSYLSNLDNHITDLESDIITKNKVLDAILASKKRTCNSKNIDFNIDLKFPENLGIEDMDTCIIFGNLIDNAIEACENIKNENIKKYIDINGGIKGNYIYVKIENSKDNIINKVRRNFITSKKDKQNHGLGIKSVNNSIKKYNGEIKIDYDENTFKVFVMIYRGS